MVLSVREEEWRRVGFFPLDWFQPQTPFTSSHPAFPSLRVPLNSIDGALIVPLALLLLLWPKHHSSRELGLGPSAYFSVDQVRLGDSETLSYET